MHKILATFFLILLCTGQPWAQTKTLTVAAADGTQSNFPELQAAFEKETGIRIEPVFSSSGKIAAEAYQPIAHTAVILKQDQEQRPAAAKRYFDFLYSPTTREILARQGYRVP